MSKYPKNAMTPNNTIKPINSTKPTILLTIDVEDWFQVENFKKYIPFSSWPSCELRVEKNTHRLLDLFDSFNGQQLTDNGEQKEFDRTTKNQQLNDKNPVSSIQNPVSDYPNYELSATSCEVKSNGQRLTDNGQDQKVRATFFVLGWIAERLPHLVREIHSRGHEVASHGYRHNLCGEESRKDLKSDLSDSKKLLEDLIGVPVYGYRAPSFSIDDDILKTIEDCGYLYDSSYNSFAIHDRYGRIALNGNSKKGVTLQLSNSFYELPISNIDIAGNILPWGGGGYFRMIPFTLFKIGVENILRKEKVYLFYLHPWEIDPEQPTVKDVSAFYKFRHYTNLRRTQSKLLKLIRNFENCHFLTCSKYLRDMEF